MPKWLQRRSEYLSPFNCNTEKGLFAFYFFREIYDLSLSVRLFSSQEEIRSWTNFASWCYSWRKWLAKASEIRKRLTYVLLVEKRSHNQCGQTDTEDELSDSSTTFVGGGWLIWPVTKMAICQEKLPQTPERARAGALSVVLSTNLSLVGNMMEVDVQNASEIILQVYTTFQFWSPAPKVSWCYKAPASDRKYDKYLRLNPKTSAHGYYNPLQKLLQKVNSSSGIMGGRALGNCSSKRRKSEELGEATWHKPEYLSLPAKPFWIQALIKSRCIPV